MGHYRPIFLFFSYFQQLTVHEILYRILLMIGFEPRTSAIRMRTLPLEPQPQTVTVKLKNGSILTMMML